MSSKVVSVIIPCFNDEAYIGVCLDSVLSQSEDDIEIICIDDGSTDETSQIITEYSKKDSRIALISQENLGAGPARNAGIECAEGEFISFMDADDYYPSDDVLAVLVNAAKEANTLVSCGYLQKDIQGKISCTDNSQYIKNAETFIYRDYQYDYEFYKYLYSARLIHENKLSFPALKRFQDPPFLVRSLNIAQVIAFTPIASYCYRRQNKTINWNSERVNDYAKGVLDLMVYSRNEKLAKLHERALFHIERDWYQPLFKVLSEQNDTTLYNTLQAINGAIVPDLIRPFRPSFPNGYTIRPLRELNDYKLLHETAKASTTSLE